MILMIYINRKNCRNNRNENDSGLKNKKKEIFLYFCCWLFLIEIRIKETLFYDLYIFFFSYYIFLDYNTIIGSRIVSRLHCYCYHS